MSFQIFNRTSATYISFPYESVADVRTQHWSLVASPWHVATLLAFYLLMVSYMPKWMARRKSYQLKELLLAYNLGMTLLNFYICKQLITNARKLNYNVWCEPCRVSYAEPEMQIAAAVWWFYISKVLEFSDTLFFILRKKTEQLSFLHVYHHSTMFVLWWIAVKWVPTGSTFFPPIVNSIVHVIMYSYYFLSALGPRIQRLLWWKRHLTKLQLLQFIVGLLWSLQNILRNCDFPKWINYTCIVYMCSFLYLFGCFYKRKYTKNYKETKTN